MSTRYFHVTDSAGREFRELDESEYVIEWVKAREERVAITLIEVPHPGRIPDWRILCVTRRALTEAEKRLVVDEIAARVTKTDQF